VNSFLSHQSSSLARFAVFLSATVALYWSTVSQLASTVWNVETFSHGILIPAIVVWLVWRNRNEIFNEPVNSSWLALLGLAACIMVWFLGKIVDFRVLQNFGLVGMIVAGWAVCVGMSVFKKSLFPALFLLFVVPFGTFLDQPLMHATADITVRTLRMLGIPVFQDGLQFRLPTGNWSVIEACSGLRYLLASIILGSLFAYLNFTSWAKRLGFVFLCIVVALIANWIRAVTVVVVGHLSNMRFGTGDDHVWYGWVFFGIVMYAVFFLANRFTEIPQTAELSPTGKSESTQNSSTQMSGKLWLPVLVALVLIISARTAATNVSDKRIRENFFSNIVATSSLSSVDNLTYEPNFTNSVSNLKLKDLKNDVNSTEIFAAYYADQVNKGKMITGENALVKTDSNWKIVTFDKPPADNQNDFFYEAIVQAGTTRRLVFYWFQFADSSTPNRYAAARIQLTRALKFQPDEAVFVAISMPVSLDMNATRNQLRATANMFRNTLTAKLESQN
jgi:exosortase A